KCTGLGGFHAGLTPLRAQRAIPFSQREERKLVMKISVWTGVCVVAVLAAASLLRGMTPAARSEPQATTVEVKIANLAFRPQALTVAAGTTVTWTNRDDIPHTVVHSDGAFKSKVLDTDEKFSFTFSKAGSYSYFCSLHPKMTGKVIVQ